MMAFETVTNNYFYYSNIDQLIVSYSLRAE